ncbi:hypothetical protein JCM16303_007108 [Sporobolomyces ruberrimus]
MLKEKIHGWNAESIKGFKYLPVDTIFWSEVEARYKKEYPGPHTTIMRRYPNGGPGGTRDEFRSLYGFGNNKISVTIVEDAHKLFSCDWDVMRPNYRQAPALPLRSKNSPIQIQVRQLGAQAGCERDLGEHQVRQLAKINKTAEEEDHLVISHVMITRDLFQKVDFNLDAFYNMGMKTFTYFHNFM